MTYQRTNVENAEVAKELVASVREMVRERLLGILSEARAMSATLDPSIRDGLMDEMTRFHPDDAAGDLLNDAFVDAETLAAKAVQDALDEMSLSVRDTGMLAAE